MIFRRLRRMSTRKRTSRFAPINGLAFIALVSGLVLAATTGASPRFGFIESASLFLGLQEAKPSFETTFKPAFVDTTILAWEMNGLAGNEATFNSTTTDANLNTSTLSRGGGLNASSLANSFSSTSFTAGADLAAAITANDFLQFTVSPVVGQMVSLSTLNANFRRSASGPNGFQWQYSLDGFSTAGSNIGSAISYTDTATNGLAQAAIDLTGISALQNVANPAVITIRLYGYGASDTVGTFAIGRLAGNDLAIIGSTSAIPPSLSINDVTANKPASGTTDFVFQVTLSSPAAAGGVTFDIATADGTATTADNDYVANSLTGQTILAGSTGPYNFTVVVNGDTNIELNETFSVNVTNVVGANVADGQGLGTIVSETIDQDYRIMLDLRDNHGFGTAFGWPTTGVPCPDEGANWSGVTCSDQRVAIIAVGCSVGNPLTTPFPGTQIAGLTALVSLEIRGCYLNSQPASNFAPLDGMTQLTKLRIDASPGITGTINDIFQQGLSPTRFPDISIAWLFGANLSGQIPAGVMQFDGTRLIRFNHASLSGTLPATGNPSKALWINANALEGVLPDYIRDATGEVFVRYNKFDVENTLPGNIDNLDPLWRTTQTVPPTNVQVTANGAGSATLTWTPIAYQDH